MMFCIFRTAVSFRAPSLRVIKTIRCSLSMIDSTTPKVILDKGKARLFQDGNPLIYGGAVREVIGDPQAGDEVVVNDHMGNTIGRGVFNPFSQYRVRIMARNYETLYSLSFFELLKVRVEQAVMLRKAVSLPSKINTVYRLVNGEGDRLGGLIVDVLGTTVVAQSSALWVEKHRDIIEKVLLETLSCDQLVWRRAEGRLKQDGYTGELDDIVSNKNEKNEKSEAEDLVVFENGVKYVVCPEDGQKTGFYCDQRDNRMMIRDLSKGKTVLDTFCYSGGFSVNAAIGGAVSVTSVDSSQPALNTADKNIVLNKVDDVVTTVKADAIAYMQKMQLEGNLYDIVICDPPKLAPTRTSLDKAKNKYTKINAVAMSLVKPGGVLLTCSCSAAMTQSENEFRYMLMEAAKQSKRDITILSTTGAAIDHPVHVAYPEGRYLTAVLCCVA